MSFVVAAPDLLQAAAQDLAVIRETLGEASASAAAPTAGVVAAAQDQVSAAVATALGSFGQEYQALNAQVQGFHEQFVNLLKGGAAAYLATEATNAEQAALTAMNGPAMGLFGQVGAAASTSGAFRAVAAQPAALLGGLGGGSVGSSIVGVVTSLESGSPLSLLSGTGLSNGLGGLTGLRSLESALLPGSFGVGAGAGLPNIAGPYQALLSHTAANLRTFDALWAAHPAPLLHQVINNQIGYAQTVAAGIGYAVRNFPALIADLPANLRAAIQGMLAFNPAPYLQQFIQNQLTYAQIVATSLQNAAHDFGAGLHTLPATFQSAFEALASGDVNGAASDIASGFGNLFFTGLDVNTTAALQIPGTSNIIATVTPTGALGDLLPILSVPGMAAQNFTNLLPPGSIPAQMSQNFTNVINALTNTSITADLSVSAVILPPAVTGSLTNTIGLPLALALDSAGAPINALNAFNASAATFAHAVQTGNGLAAAGALIDAPASITDGFLNGQSALPLTLDISGVSATLNLPLDGILVPQTPYMATLSLPAPIGAAITLPVGGTPISGLLTGLYDGSMQLADVIRPG